MLHVVRVEGAAPEFTRRVGRGHPDAGKAPVRLRHFKGIGCQSWIRLFQDASCDGFGGRGGKIAHRGITRSRADIVGIPENTISPTTVNGTLITEPIAKTGLEDPVEPPAPFFEQTLVEFGNSDDISSTARN